MIAQQVKHPRIVLVEDDEARPIGSASSLRVRDLFGPHPSRPNVVSLRGWTHRWLAADDLQTEGSRARDHVYRRSRR